MKNIKLLLLLGCVFNTGEIAFAVPPKTVVAGPESTIYGIAYDNGILTQALIAANKKRLNLKPPYVLTAGQVLIIPSPNEHVMGEDETLKTVADNYGVNVDVLAQENAGQPLRPGESLSIPSRDTESITEALRPSSEPIATSSLDPLPTVKAVPAAGGGVERVLSHSSVPMTHLPNELAEEIAREKGEQYDASRPMLMGNMTQGNAGAPTAATTLVREEQTEDQPKKEVKKETSKKEKATKPKEKPRVEGKVKEKKAVAEKAESEDLKQPQFTWPVNGTVVSKFNPGKNDGIKIKVDEGTAVKAAAAGDVLYAGSELKGFGNLLLLKHPGGWVTAYAYNSSLLVKKGDKVKQGQVIAKSGKTGDAKEPQLHFEVRKGKQPVDPLTQLES